MTGSPPPLGLFLAALVALSACGGSQSQLPQVATSTSPVVATVKVVPAEVLAGLGEQVQLVATALDQVGDWIDLGLHECLTLDWTADRAGASVSGSANTAMVSAPDAGDLRVTATVRAVAAAECVSDPPPQPISGEAVIHTTVALPTAPWDQVYAEKLPAGELVALMIRGQVGGTETNEHLGAVGAVDLAKNVTPRADGTSELIAFAQDHAVVARGPTPTQDAWTTGQDIVDADPQPDFGFRQLPVMVGLPPSGSVSAAWAADQIKDAAELLNRNRVGIDLDYVGHFTHTSVGVSSPTAACTTANVNATVAGQAPVNGGAHILYVIFVDDSQAENRGWACTPEIEVTGLPQHDWSSRAVFVSSTEYTVTTVAHEIVHVLGLRTGHVDRIHTNTVAGFDSSNLMWGTDILHKASLRDHLSLGQAYRMNFHSISWLNAEILKYAGDQRITRNCEMKTGDGVCPALAADLGG